MTKKHPKMTARDIAFAIKEFQAWGSGERGRGMTWGKVAKATGFSRQALECKPDIYAAYDAACKALAGEVSPQKPKSDDFHLDKIERLEKDLKRYKALEADWLERWIRIAYHARGKGLSIDELDKPLPPVARR
jgi:hypothetical protein